nr:hypothetical protein [Ralstonia solanacearum]
MARPVLLILLLLAGLWWLSRQGLRNARPTPSAPAPASAIRRHLARRSRSSNAPSAACMRRAPAWSPCLAGAIAAPNTPTRPGGAAHDARRIRLGTVQGGR